MTTASKYVSSVRSVSAKDSPYKTIRTRREGEGREGRRGGRRKRGVIRERGKGVPSHNMTAGCSLA